MFLVITVLLAFPLSYTSLFQSVFDWLVIGKSRLYWIRLINGLFLLTLGHYTSKKKGRVACVLFSLSLFLKCSSLWSFALMWFKSTRRAASLCPRLLSGSFLCLRLPRWQSTHYGCLLVQPWLWFLLCIYFHCFLHKCPGTVVCLLFSLSGFVL